MPSIGTRVTTRSAYLDVVVTTLVELTQEILTTPHFSDLNVNEHKIFFRELLSLCEAEDAMLGKLPCYKGVNLMPLRASALKALASCHYIQEKHCREKIFQVLYKSLEKNDPDLQQVRTS